MRRRSRSRGAVASRVGPRTPGGERLGGVTVSRGPDERAEAQAKERTLDGILESMGSVLVAYSGGVDSSYLAVRAHRVLGERALAVTADSESLAEAQRA